MGRKRKKKNKFKNPLQYVAVPKMDVSSEIKKTIIAICIVLLGILALLSLFQLAGPFGSFLEKGQELSFGWGKWLFPILLIVWGIFVYKDDKSFVKGAHILGLFLLLISILSFFHFFLPFEEWEDVAHEGIGGGFVGMYLALGFRNVLGFWGGLVSILALLSISLLLIFNTSLLKIFGEESVIGKIFYPFKLVFSKIFNRNKEEYEEQEEAEVEEESAEELEEEFTEEEQDDGEVLDFTKKLVTDNPDEDEEIDESLVSTKKASAKNSKTEDSLFKPNKVKIELPLSLLDKIGGKPSSGDIKNNAIIIQKTLENFGIPVDMHDTAVGPTVTQYSFKPREGVKLSKITTLSNDLALALAAHPIRIEAPIPGKSLVGIEVPNKTKAVVSLKEIIDSNDFKTASSKLTVSLGKDVSGKEWSYDITKMPHLLVAGATGSGKSVCLNSIVVSLLYQNNPEDLRFIMVDPKRVELTVYDGIPHLLTPVITNVAKTINALRWCLNEMDRRFEVLALDKKRNISSYNKIAKEKMPYIVFIIDELADLMVAASKDIESSIIRLSQMARAVGIHLILATQRPSVDVITGLIKANTPARIAFSVASAIDSKTILDTQGAEKLLGKGDMLFLTAEISKPKRIQGCFVSDEEIKKIVDYIKERSGEFEYVSGVTERQKVGGIAGVGLEGNPNDETDELFDDAKEIVVSAGRASASLLQRKFSIGYSRAARIMDELEEAGIVGPSNGAKPREILISKEQLDSMVSTPMAGATIHNRDEAEAPESYLGDDEEENSLGEVPDSPAVLASESDDESEEKDEESEDEESEDVAVSNNDSKDEDEESEESVEDEPKEDEQEKSENKKSFNEDDGIFFSR